MKAVGTLPDDPNLHRAALAYASDHTILEPVLRGHGIAWVTPGLKVASLDHAMWWHRDARVDEWLLYVQESPNSIGGRGLSFGRIYDRAGHLLASVAQEGMIRVPVLALLRGTCARAARRRATGAWAVPRARRRAVRRPGRAGASSCCSG